MEVIEADPTAVQRIQDALDGYERSNADSGAPNDPGAQIDVLIRAAESRAGGSTGPRSPIPERRHIVHQGRRIGTLTRNGGQWVFRFATSIPDTEVYVLAERLAIPVAESDAQPPAQTSIKRRT
jgi:ParB family chromosome partitioning protein